MARQAPIDRKMKTVDTIMLKNIAAREEMESPAARLYDDWDNSYAHRATEMPDRYRIDLRNFCMPTPSRVVTSNFGWRWGREHKGLDIKPNWIEDEAEYGTIIAQSPDANALVKEGATVTLKTRWCVRARR